MRILPVNSSQLSPQKSNVHMFPKIRLINLCFIMILLNLLTIIFSNHDGESLFSHVCLPLLT